MECGFEVGSVLDGLAEDGRAEGVEGARGGVDNDEAVVGEGGGDEAREGGGEGCVGGVGGDEQVELWRAADEFRGAVEDGGDACAEREIADGLCDVGATRECRRSVCRAWREGRMTWSASARSWSSVASQKTGTAFAILGALDDGGGFEEGEEGSAEEGDLLAADDGAGSLAETLDVGESLRAGIPAAVLFEQMIGEGGAMRGVLRGDGVRPRIATREWRRRRGKGVRGSRCNRGRAGFAGAASRWENSRPSRQSLLKVSHARWPGMGTMRGVICDGVVGNVYPMRWWGRRIHHRGHRERRGRLVRPMTRGPLKPKSGLNGPPIVDGRVGKGARRRMAKKKKKSAKKDAAAVPVVKKLKIREGGPAKVLSSKVVVQRAAVSSADGRDSRSRRARK